MSYERGIIDVSSKLLSQHPNHRAQCLAGIARMSIRCGDSRKGVNIAMDNDSSRSLRKECAEILEAMKASVLMIVEIIYQMFLRNLKVS